MKRHGLLIRFTAAHGLKRRAVSVLPAVAALALPAATQAGHCDIVDRGDPLDGVTTITVLDGPAPCADEPEFDGWQCLTVRSAANPDGLIHDVEVRWNLVGQTPAASFTWLSGTGGDQFLRLRKGFADAVQDEVAAEGIRTIELRYVLFGGYDVEMNGSMNVAANLADIWEHLITTGVMVGVRGHVGNSGGAQLGADCLAYHDAEQVIDVFLHTGGPMFVNLELTCTDPDSSIYGSAFYRGRIDDLPYGDVDEPYCTNMDPDPEPSYDCRSTLGTEADVVYDGTIICMVIGLNESDWVKATSTYYFENVTAGTLTYESPQAPHVVFETLAGAEAVEARMLEAVNAVLGPPADFDANGEVDLADAAQFVACLSGPGGGTEPGCLAGNTDADNDVDTADFSVLQNVFTGP